MKLEVVVVTLAVASVACAARPASGEDTSTEAGSDTGAGPATTGTGRSEATGTGPSDATTDGGELPACPAPAAPTLTVELDMPDNPNARQEGNVEDVRTAACTLDAVGGDAASGWQLALTCDDDIGGIAAPYVVTIEAAESPFGGIDAAAPLELSLHAYSWFEVGGGLRLSLRQAGTTALVAILEEQGGGLSGVCADPGDAARVDADAWLSEIGVHVEDGACADPAVLRLVRSDDPSAEPRYSGSSGPLGAGLFAVVPLAECFVSGAETWQLRALVYAS